MDEMNKGKRRLRMNRVDIHDESTPGNPLTARIDRLEAKSSGEVLISLQVTQFMKDPNGDEWPVLSTRNALEVAAALIHLAIGQRFTLPENALAAKPHCAVCGSEAELDADGHCPDHSEVR